MAEHGRDEAVTERLLEQLASEGRRLVEAHRRGPADAAVPGTEWSAREVFAHTGAVHRWAADIVERSLPTNETGGSAAFAWTGPDEMLLDWFDEGLDRLVATLRRAPADLHCYTFVADVPPREFWIRRQAHETAIHRGDVEAAAGTGVGEVEPWFAQDGLGEIVAAFAREPRFAVRRPGRLLLLASDGPWWRITFGRDGNRVDTGDFAAGEADAIVRGRSDLLYRWAWNRPVDGLDLQGDPDVLDAWRRTVRIT